MLVDIPPSQQFFPSGPYEASPRAEGKNRACARLRGHPEAATATAALLGRDGSVRRQRQRTCRRASLLIVCERPLAWPLRRLTRSRPGG